jgi:AraC family transcriptional regulator
MSARKVAMSITMNSASMSALAGTGALRDLASSVLSLLQNATTAVERDREAAKIFIAKASTLLQVEVARSDAPEVNAASGGLAPWKIRRLKAYIEENLAQPIRVTDLSEIAGLSATHFSRAFRRSLGEAPHVYLILRRLERARHMMLVSDMALSELAIACGFSDQAHFCKLFRRYTGKTPGAWRRERSDGIRAKAVSMLAMRVAPMENRTVWG